MKMSLKKFYFCFAAGMYFGAYPVQALADEMGPVERADMAHKKVIAAESNKVRCYQSPKYLVIAKDLGDKGGTDFIIKYKAKADEMPPCSYVVEHGDFEIKNEWVEYFAGLTGDFLILDSTTGPGPSGLTIWDLKNRKKVYDGLWEGPAEIKDDSIIYWVETGEATDDNCPDRAMWELHGLGAAIETQVILTLSDLRISETQKTRCSPRQ